MKYMYVQLLTKHRSELHILVLAPDAKFVSASIHQVAHRTTEGGLAEYFVGVHTRLSQALSCIPCIH